MCASRTKDGGVFTKSDADDCRGSVLLNSGYKSTLFGAAGVHPSFKRKAACEQIGQQLQVPPCERHTGPLLDATHGRCGPGSSAEEPASS